MKRFFRFLIIFFLALHCLLSAQDDQRKPLLESKSYLKESTPTPRPSPTPPPDPDNLVLCLIDDRRLTQAMVDKMLEKLLADKKGTDEHLAKLRFVYTQNIMTEWLERNLLAAEAEKEGIKVTDEELTQQEEDLKKAARVTFEIDNALSKLGQSKDEYHRQLKDALLGEKLIRRRMQAFYSDQDLRKMYSSSPENFQRAPRVRAAHILYPFKGNESSNDKKSLKNWMEEARKKMKNGIDPMEIVKQEDSSLGIIGGDLGWLYANNLMPEPLNSLVFKLKVGEVSDVVETQYGFYIIRAEEKQPLYGRTYEEAREAVLDSVFEEVRQKVLLGAKQSHKIRINMGGIPKDKM
jgi:parvulin-like peptidyl-prolyl isomerase